MSLKILSRAKALNAKNISSKIQKDGKEEIDLSGSSGNHEWFGGGSECDFGKGFGNLEPCDGCSLQNEKGLVCRGDVGITGLCYDGMRRDNKQVVFKEVSENEKPLDSLLNGDFTN